MFKMGAKIDRRVPKSRLVRHSGLPEPPLVVLNVACWSIGLLLECSGARFSMISSIWDPFCGWFWIVFWYIWGSDTLQLPHNFDKSQGRACSNFNVFMYAVSIILTYFKQNPGSGVLEFLIFLNTCFKTKHAMHTDILDF